jgi:hypothetical protein
MSQQILKTLSKNAIRKRIDYIIKEAPALGLIPFSKSLSPHDWSFFNRGVR